MLRRVYKQRVTMNACTIKEALDWKIFGDSNSFLDSCKTHVHDQWLKMQETWSATFSLPFQKVPDISWHCLIF